MEWKQLVALVSLAEPWWLLHNANLLRILNFWCFLHFLFLWISKTFCNLIIYSLKVFLVWDQVNTFLCTKSFLIQLTPKHPRPCWVQSCRKTTPLKSKLDCAKLGPSLVFPIGSSCRYLVYLHVHQCLHIHSIIFARS